MLLKILQKPIIRYLQFWLMFACLTNSFVYDCGATSDSFTDDQEEIRGNTTVSQQPITFTTELRTGLNNLIQSLAPIERNDADEAYKNFRAYLSFYYNEEFKEKVNLAVKAGQFDLEVGLAKSRQKANDGMPFFMGAIKALDLQRDNACERAKHLLELVDLNASEQKYNTLSLEQKDEKIASLKEEVEKLKQQLAQQNNTENQTQEGAPSKAQQNPQPQPMSDMEVTNTITQIESNGPGCGVPITLSPDQLNLILGAINKLDQKISVSSQTGNFPPPPPAPPIAQNSSTNTKSKFERIQQTLLGKSFMQLEGVSLEKSQAEKIAKVVLENIDSDNELDNEELKKLGVEKFKKVFPEASPKNESDLGGAILWYLYSGQLEGQELQAFEGLQQSTLSIEDARKLVRHAAGLKSQTSEPSITQDDFLKNINSRVISLLRGAKQNQARELQGILNLFKQVFYPPEQIVGESYPLGESIPFSEAKKFIADVEVTIDTHLQNERGREEIVITINKNPVSKNLYERLQEENFSQERSLSAAYALVARDKIVSTPEARSTVKRVLNPQNISDQVRFRSVIRGFSVSQITDGSTKAEEKSAEEKSQNPSKDEEDNSQVTSQTSS
ncbi:MAG: hypothetical protein ABFQ95_02330 [Pseudomonadota bacterium]